MFVPCLSDTTGKRCAPVVKELLNDRPLDKKHRDHELSGEYEAVRECHIVADMQRDPDCT